MKECHKKACKEEEKEIEVKQKKKKHNKNRSPELKMILSEHLNREESELIEKVLPNFEMPQALLKYNYADMPVSLRPPTFKDLIDYDLNSWSDNHS